MPFEMMDWWEALGGGARIFWGIAIAATIFQLLLFAGTFITGHDLDHPTEAGHDVSSEPMKLLTLRAIVAFLVGFGWAGALFLGNGQSLLAATLIALGAGGVFMAVVLFLMRLLLSLKSDGTVNYQNAIGSNGRVYVTIPANRTGEGQVEIMIQGRLATVRAITTHHQPLPPQTPVVVHGVDSPNLLVVTPS